MIEILKTFYEWNKWPGLMHNILLLLIIYIIYVLITNKHERKLKNILLFTIVIGIDIIIHQIINYKNNTKTEYI